MEEKHKKILERNRFLLTKNIILTDDFYRYLKAEHVLPETMLRDVREGASREDRINTLLQTLRLRGCHSYRKFCHVLYLTGHYFLADYLYREEIESKVLKGEEVFSKFSSIFNHVSDDTKEKLLLYLESKIKEKALYSAWVKSGPERCDQLEAKKTAFESQKDLKTKLDAKTRQVRALRDELEAVKEEKKKRDLELLAATQKAADIRLSLQEELTTQTRFNAANNHSILQLRERFDALHDKVKVLNVALRSFLDSDTADDIETDANNMKVSLLERNVRRVLQIARTNIESASNNELEKETVLNLLRTSSRHKYQNLSDVVRRYVDKMETGHQALSQEIGGLLQLLQGSRIMKVTSKHNRYDLKALRSQFATLRVEVEHIRKKLDWKDGQITDLVKENNALREAGSRSLPVPPPVAVTPSLTLLPQIHTGHANRSHESPDSVREIEMVYKEFDRYVLESSSPPSSVVRKHRGSLADVNLERDTSPRPSLRSGRQSKPEAQATGSSKEDSIRKRTENRSMPVPKSSTDDRTALTGHTDTTDGLQSKTLPDIATSQVATRHVRAEAGGAPSVPLLRRDRRPSLADLITIYENSQTEMTTNGLEQNKPELRSVAETPMELEQALDA